MNPRKVLAIFANPLGTVPLELGTEGKAIADAVRLSTKRAVDIAPLYAVTIDDLQNGLRNHQPAILHISAHGSEVGLALQDENGEIKTIDPGRLAEQLTQYIPPLDVVVLNACYSAAHAKAFDTFNVSWLIAMEDQVSDEGAIAFAEMFYRTLGDGYDVERAYSEAIGNLKLKGISDYDIIRIYDHRSAERKEADRAPKEEEPEKKPAWWSRLSRVAAVLSALVALLTIGGSVTAMWRNHTAKPTMSFLRNVDDNGLMRFSVANNYREAVLIKDVQLICTDPDVAKTIEVRDLKSYGDAIPKEKGDGYFDLGADVIWKKKGAKKRADEYLARHKDARITVKATAVTASGKEFPMESTIRLGDIADYLKEIGNPCEMTAEGCT